MQGVTNNWFNPQVGRNDSRGKRYRDNRYEDRSGYGDGRHGNQRGSGYARPEDRRDYRYDEQRVGKRLRAGGDERSGAGYARQDQQRRCLL